MLFPSGFIITANNLDMNMLREYQKAWNVESTQLEQGTFLGDINGVHTPNIQLASTQFSHKLMVKGTFPEGAITLFFIDSLAQSVVDNYILKEYEVLVGNHQDELDIICNAQSSTYTVAIEEKLFNESFYNYFGIDTDDSLKGKRLLVEGSRLEHLYQGLKQWLNYLRSAQGQSRLQDGSDAIELEILTHVYSCMHVENREQTRTKFDVSSARDLLDESLITPLDITTLSQKLKISERQLHNAFLNTYGITPKKYLQRLRLNAARKELLIANPENLNIANIAHKYNYTQMSYFASEYKKMFGELPSETIIRSS